MALSTDSRALSIAHAAKSARPFRSRRPPVFPCGLSARATLAQQSGQDFECGTGYRRWYRGFRFESGAMIEESS
jgi:hypothetical protein